MLTSPAASVLIGLLAAYAFSRTRFRGRRAGLPFLLLTQKAVQIYVKSQVRRG